MGKWKAVSLSMAQDARDDAKRFCPWHRPKRRAKAGQVEAFARAANSFEQVAREWYARRAKVWVERQLAHCERNDVRGAYNRAEYLTERRTMMQQHADMLNALVGGAKVIPVQRASAARQ